MKVILLGATGMVGQGVLRECLRDDAVQAVLALGRSELDLRHPKLRQIVLADLTDLSSVEDELTGYDACFFCLGVSSTGMREEAYRRVTYDLTLGIARTLGERSPGLTFVYVSAQGADSSERGRVMWARVRGRTENDLLALPGIETYLLRPGFIQPMHGATSKTRLYRVFYAVLPPLFPLLKRLMPDQLTTTEQVGRAMIAVAEAGAPSRVLGTREINAAAAG